MKILRTLALVVCALVCSRSFAQNAALLPVPRLQFFDQNGYPLSGGLVFTCVAGSTCPGTTQTSWTDSTGGTANPNPVVLDAGGTAAIWLGKTAYKIVIENSSGVVVSTTDNVVNNGFAFTALQCAANGMACLDANGHVLQTELTYNSGAAGAINRSIASKLGDAVSFKDFGAVGNGVTDDSAAVLAAFNAVCGATYMPQPVTGGGSTYAIAATVTIPACDGLKVLDAKFVPTASFTSGYLLQTVTSGFLSDGFALEDGEFFNVEFDGTTPGGSTHKADGFLCNACERVNVLNSRFFHFPNYGYRVTGTGTGNSGAHDNIVAFNKFFEYRYPDANYNTGPYTGTAIQVDQGDTNLEGNIGGYTNVGAVFNSQMGTSTNEHWYTATKGIWVTSNGAYTSLINPYIDSCNIEVDAPWNLRIIGGRFLVNSTSTTLPNSAFISLVAPYGPALYVYGLEIIGNTFYDQNVSGTLYDMAVVGPGSFSTANFKDLALYPNGHSNVARYSGWDGLATIYTGTVNASTVNVSTLVEAFIGHFNGGTVGQGTWLGADTTGGGVGGAYIGPVGTITGTNRAVTLANGAGNPAFWILGNGNVVDNGQMQIPGLKATTGTRYLCIDTGGNLVSSATACSGT